MTHTCRACIVVCLASALAPTHASAQTPGATRAAIRKALTFHASFDHGPNADVARGNPHIYTAPSYGRLGEATPGIADSDVAIAEGQDRFGGALRFRRKHTQALFFKAQGNVAYRKHDWSGTISFWLKLDPDSDLAPGYADPIQLTDKAYNDAAVWVDFTRDDKPRHFRLGVFGDMASWNPDSLPPERNAFFNARTIVVTNPPFGRDRWTNVVVTFAGLNTSAGGTAKLYLNGTLMGTRSGIRDPFTWNVSRATIRLGVNYVGLWDDLSLYDRALTANEVKTLYRLDGGVSARRSAADTNSSISGRSSTSRALSF